MGKHQFRAPDFPNAGGLRDHALGCRSCVLQRNDGPTTGVLSFDGDLGHPLLF